MRIRYLYPAAEINGGIRSTGMLGLTGDCFRTLGIHVQLGRTITRTDDYRGTERIVVITESLWRSAFAGSPEVLGKRIQVHGAMFTVVGVAEKRFTGLLVGFPAGMIIPLQQEATEVPAIPGPIYYWVNILARRANGVPENQLFARIAAERQRLLEASVPHRYNTAQRKNYFSKKLTVTPARTGVDYFLRRRFGEPLYALFGICGAILLIGCVNWRTCSWQEAWLGGEK